MRHGVGGRQFGRASDHRVAMFRNLVTDALRYEAITTTEAKAKEIRPMVEKVITIGKENTVYARRKAARILYDPLVVRKVFDVIAPRLADRKGGYVRITKLGPRRGDGAEMARLEVLD
ncbi:MAG: 50S ribosomal protein L17 [Dehalococcoidia bacterium]